MALLLSRESSSERLKPQDSSERITATRDPERPVLVGELPRAGETGYGGGDPTWRPLVSLVIRFSPPSLTAQQYDEVVRRLTEAGVLPADGLDYEICFGSDGNLKVSQVWDSREQLDAFGERLRPILAELGINPGEPEVLEVHNIIKR